MRSIVLFSGICALALNGLAAEPGGAVRPTSNNDVLVEINGTKITLADFERKHPTALFQAHNSFYDAKRKAVEAFVDEYLLEQEAKKSNITVAQLLEREVTSKIAKDP